MSFVHVVVDSKHTRTANDIYNVIAQKITCPNIAWKDATQYLWLCYFQRLDMVILIKSYTVISISLLYLADLNFYIFYIYLI